MQQPSKYSAARVAGREHIPLFPKGFIGLRIVQLVLAVVILGLTAFGTAVFAFDAEVLMLFTALATMISSIYIIVVEFAPNAAKGYNYWAILGLDIFLLVFWLVSFALLASVVGAGLGLCDYYYSCYDGDYIYGGILAGAAGLGGVQFALYITSLAIHSVMLHRHRAAGLHCTPGEAPSAANGMGGEKMQMQPQPAPAMYAAPVAGVQQQQQQQPMGGFVQQQPQMYAQGAPVQGYYQQVPSPAPLSSQPTGGSYVQMPVQPQHTGGVPPPMPGAQQLYGNA